MCSVQGGANKLGKACIDNGKLLYGSLLYVKYLGDQTSALCHNGTAQLKVKLLSGAELEFVAEYIEVLLKVRNRVLLGVYIVNTKTAANVNAIQFNTFSLQLVLQVIYLIAEQMVGLHVQDLRTYVEVQAFKLETGVGQCLADNGEEHGNLNSKLVLGLTGGYVGVCMGINIGVYAESYAGALTQGGTTLGNHVKLGLGLYVKAGNTCIQSQVNLPIGLAYTCKYY